SQPSQQKYLQIISPLRRTLRTEPKSAESGIGKSYEAMAQSAAAKRITLCRCTSLTGYEKSRFIARVETFPDICQAQA
ncbi:MAG: hypothetical protein WB608_23660, partial [Terracidiphilus sp.]